MKQVRLTVKENTEIADNVVSMLLEGDVSAVSAPGQFINIELPGLFLRRPISVCDVISDADPIKADNGNGCVRILYKAVGKGTELMKQLPEGTVLDVLTGLGNGFDTKCLSAGQTALLLGGGIGSAPMLMLAKQLLSKGIKVQAVLGFNTAAEVFLAEELKDAGAAVTVMTADGSSVGESAEYNTERGFVTDARAAAEGAFDYYYACGPMPMLKAVYNTVSGDGELSFEERMGCGFGACMGCTMETVSGPKRICKDGPVFNRSELMWG